MLQGPPIRPRGGAELVMPRNLPSSTNPYSLFILQTSQFELKCQQLSHHLHVPCLYPFVCRPFLFERRRFPRHACRCSASIFKQYKIVPKLGARKHFIRAESAVVPNDADHDIRPARSPIPRCHNLPSQILPICPAGLFTWPPRR